MITCTVTIDSTPVGTTPDQLDAGQPTALDGLTVTWGRATRLDQPKPSSCTLSILLPRGTSPTRFMPGKPLSVTARVSDTTPSTVTVIAAPGTQTLTNSPTHFTPTPTVTPSTNPAAWDNLPRVEIGATYTITGTVNLPPASTLHVRPVYYTGPHADSLTIGPTIHTTTTTSGAISITHTPPPDTAGTWLGISLHVHPLGATISASYDYYIYANSHTLDSLEHASITALRVTRTGTATSHATVFDGRISDAILSYNEDAKCAQIDLIAVDPSVELDNIPIGDEPWPAESAAHRARRILNLAGSSAHLVIDPTIANRMIQRADADNQPARRQLQSIAITTGAILWTASHESVGDIYRLEDPAQRKSLYRLTLDPSGNTHLTPAPWNTLTLDAATLYRRGIELRQDTTDLATSVTVSWQYDQPNDQGEPTLTNRDETVHDIDRRRTHGHHHLKVSTNLTNAHDANTLAHQLITNTAPGAWMLPKATWDTKTLATRPADVITALDSMRRIGLPLTLTNVDEWVPGAPTIPVYLDGGKYTYARGRWVLDLSFTRSTLADSLTINQSDRLTISRTPQTLDQLAAATI